MHLIEYETIFNKYRVNIKFDIHRGNMNLKNLRNDLKLIKFMPKWEKRIEIKPKINKKWAYANNPFQILQTQTKC